MQERLAATKKMPSADDRYATPLGLLVIGKVPTNFLPGVTVSAVRGLDAPLFVFVVRDRVTEYNVRPVVVGTQQNDRGGWTLRRDWEVLKMLNPIRRPPSKPHGRTRRCVLGWTKHVGQGA